jgi:hypothetical protein
MYLLEIDRTLNRMHIILSGRFDEAESLALLGDVRSRYNEVTKGFHVLCDLATLNEFDPPARAHFRAVMDLCNEAGVGKVVRIIPNPQENFELTIMSYIHYNSGIPVVSCKTLAEASKHLK